MQIIKLPLQDFENMESQVEEDTKEVVEQELVIPDIQEIAQQEDIEEDAEKNVKEEIKEEEQGEVIDNTALLAEVSKLKHQLLDMQAKIKLDLDKLAEEASILSMEIAKKVISSLPKKLLVEDTTEFIKRSIVKVLDEPNLSIRAHPDVCGALGEIQNVNIIPSENNSVDCSIEWEHGILKRDQAIILDSIRTSVNEFIEEDA